MASTGFILPASADLEAIVGADWSTTVQLFSDEGQTVPFDLSGYSASLKIGTPTGGNLFTLTVGAGLTIATPANGMIVAALTHSQTTSVVLGSSGLTQQHYSLGLTDASGNVSFPLAGQLTFRAP